jgi:hypothetical protein
MYMGYPNDSRMIGSTRYQAHNDNNAFVWSASCDEAKMPIGWYWSNTWNMGGITVGSASQEDINWPVRFNALRYCYIMMDRIKKVPDVDADYAALIKGEMQWLIADNYFEMVKRYGGVPIVRKYYQVGDNFKIPRASLQETFDFIIANLDSAAAVLPDAWPTNWKGRITKGAALALKAKALLYAASPLFNTDTPYLSMADPANNNLICFGNYDANRWKAAADAAKATIDWAPQGGVALVTNAIGGGPTKNYKYAWEVLDNPEIIIAEKFNGLNGLNKTGSSSMPWATIMPNPMGGWTGVCPTQTFIEKFYDKTDGTPQTWSDNGTDLNQKYAQLDPRFAQTIGYNGCKWNNSTTLETFLPDGKHKNYCVTGYWMKKFIPDAETSAGVKTPVSWPYLRLNEMYLIYAEALNEFSAAPPQEAYDAVNTIRTRSGMPALPAGLTQDQFRQRVRKEWGVEFAFEDHRFWDIKRWMIAEDPGVMQGPITVLTVNKFGTGTPQQFQYTRTVLENRVWKRFTYLNPFRIAEVNKGYIIQNPGY